MNKFNHLLIATTTVLSVIDLAGCATDNATLKPEDNGSPKQIEADRSKSSGSNCGNPSTTIQPPKFGGDFPLLGSCLGTNVSVPPDEVIFVVTKWQPSTDENGRNIHTYYFDKMDACLTWCNSTNKGVVDDLYIIACEDNGQCGAATPLAEPRTKITLKKTH
jgi:hypothetical protein